MLLNDGSFTMAKTVDATAETEVAAGKRVRILRAAVEVFARSGYFSSRVSSIAKEAGVADGTIYLYFQGKEDLLVTIFREQMEAFLGRIRTSLAGLDDPEESLRRIVRDHLAASGEDRALAVVFQVELRHTLKFMTLFSQHEFGEYLATIRRVVEAGQTSGAFRGDVHAQVAAKAIFGALDEMVTSWVLSDKVYRLEESAEQVAEFVLRGLRVTS